MEGKPFAARVFEDIEPSEEWAREQAYDTFLVHLPGYKKENLKVQVTSARYVKVFGERPVGHDNKWERFHREIPIHSNCDPNDISAKFENGVLYVKFPKMIAPAVDKEVPKNPTTTEAPKPPTTEAPKPPTTEAPKPPKETLQPPATQAPKLPKPMSTSEPQPQKTGANDQEQSKKSNGATSQGQISNYMPPRTTEKEKEPSRVSKSSNQVEAEATNAAQKTLDKDKSGDGLGKVAAKRTEKLDEGRGKQVEDSTKEELRGAIFGHAENKAGVEQCCFRPQGYNYNQVVDGLVMEMKQQPRKMVSLGLAFLFVLVLVLYLKHTINSIQEIKRQEL